LASLENLWSYTSQDSFPTWEACQLAQNLLHRLLDLLITLSSSSSFLVVRSLHQLLRGLEDLLGPGLAARLLLRHVLDQLTELWTPAHALLLPVGLLALVRAEGSGGWRREGPEEAGQLLARGLQQAAGSREAENTLDVSIR
jgi:hypothetical protein